MNVSTGEMIEIYSNTNMGIIGTWSSPNIVPAVDTAARTVLVPGKNGKRSTVEFEDVRLSLPLESFA